jgi:hypothetical protein
MEEAALARPNPRDSPAEEEEEELSELPEDDHDDPWFAPEDGRADDSLSEEDGAHENDDSEDSDGRPRKKRRGARSDKQPARCCCMLGFHAWVPQHGASHILQALLRPPLHSSPLP